MVILYNDALIRDLRFPGDETWSLSENKSGPASIRTFNRNSISMESRFALILFFINISLQISRWHSFRVISANFNIHFVKIQVSIKQ